MYINSYKTLGNRVPTWYLRVKNMMMINDKQMRREKLAKEATDMVLDERYFFINFFYGLPLP